MEIFKRSKIEIMQRKQTLNQRMCKRHKVRLGIFSTLTLSVKGTKGDLVFFDVDSYNENKKKLDVGN